MCIPHGIEGSNPSLSAKQSWYNPRFIGNCRCSLQQAGWRLRYRVSDICDDIVKEEFFKLDEKECIAIRVEEGLAGLGMKN